MEHYRYRAINEKGETLNGRIRAGSRADAVQSLQKRGYSVLDLREVAGTTQTFGVKVLSNKRMRNSFLVALALVGVVMAYALGDGETFEVRRPEAFPTQSIAIQGRVTRPVGKRKGLTLVFHLPEVPLRIERSCAELVTDDGSYLLRHELQSPREVKYYVVELVESDETLKRSPEIPLGEVAPDL